MLNLATSNILKILSINRIVDKKIIDELDPESIEEMSVLKDQKAIEAPGEKGKNGVILIKTKQEAKQQKNTRLGAIASTNKESKSAI